MEMLHEALHHKGGRRGDLCANLGVLLPDWLAAHGAGGASHGRRPLADEPWQRWVDRLESLLLSTGAQRCNAAKAPAIRNTNTTLSER